MAEFDAVVAEHNALIAGRDAQIAVLQDQVAALTTQVATLLAQLESQRKQNSNNSSKPPSSDPPHGPFRANKPTGKKPGRRDGHEGVTNTPFAADEVTAAPLVPGSCGHCGSDFDPDAPCTSAPLVFQSIDLPETPPAVIEYQRQERCCASCGRLTRASLPDDVGLSPYGPRLQAMVVTWALQFHLSRLQIQALLASQYGLTICTATIQTIIERMASACEKPVEELKTAINNAPVVNADETGHKHQGGGAKGKRHWLWVAVTLGIAVFAAAADRGADGLAMILNKGYKGIVGCDRWKPYESCFGANRQLCWAHLKREGQGAVDRAEVLMKSKDQAVRACGERLLAWGQVFLKEYEAMFASWGRFKAGGLTRPGLRGVMVCHQTSFRELFNQGLTLEDKKVKGMSKDLLRPVQWKSLWTFVTVEGVEPTNNRAEQAIRQPVLLRRKSGGTRSAIGMKALATLLSVVETCRRQGLSIVGYFEAVIRSQRLGQPPPSLVPA